MQQRLRLVVSALVAAAVLSLFSSNFAQAEDFQYATIGWWGVTYREVDDLNGCQATAHFNDETTISIALIQDVSSRSWHV